MCIGDAASEGSILGWFSLIARSSFPGGNCRFACSRKPVRLRESTDSDSQDYFTLIATRNGEQAVIADSKLIVSISTSGRGLFHVLIYNSIEDSGSRKWRKSFLWCEVRDNKLHVETDKTFDGWIRRVFNRSRSRAYQLLDYADVLKSMPTNVANQPNELHARLLKKLDSTERECVWLEAMTVLFIGIIKRERVPLQCARFAK